MNTISLMIFLLLCFLFLGNGIYQGVANDSWTALLIAIIVIIFGARSMWKRQNKKRPRD
ncbi:hypothetical protein [Halobacillus sp. K22]|uniref:hypothetical protein n=1 Tax=Halobacillus sp. K22 TaxID=3457431 RepID=UPI003FCC95A5